MTRKVACPLDPNAGFRLPGVRQAQVGVGEEWATTRPECAIPIRIRAGNEHCHVVNV